MEGREKKLFIILTILLAVILGLLFYIKIKSTHPEFSVTFFNVGQGDSALIKFIDGKKMLIDCGINRNVLSSLGKALPFFDRTIDYLVVTHPDADHYGGCPDVLRRYQVKNIITNGITKNENDPYWQAWQKYSQTENANLKIINQPEEMSIGQAQIKFLSPDNTLPAIDKIGDGNNKSIVFILKYQSKSFIFTGDMEEPLENILIDKYCASTTPCSNLHADYLKVGHHGSDSSTGVRFLEAVNPQFAIISVGKNSFGHPSLRVLRKLERIPAQIWRTDEKNDIIIQ